MNIERMRVWAVNKRPIYRKRSAFKSKALMMMLLLTLMLLFVDLSFFFSFLDITDVYYIGILIVYLHYQQIKNQTSISREKKIINSQMCVASLKWNERCRSIHIDCLVRITLLKNLFFFYFRVKRRHYTDINDMYLYRLIFIWF